MSNKVQVNCSLSNKFAVWRVKHLEKVLNTQYSYLKDLDQRIRDNKEAFDYCTNQNFPNTLNERDKRTLIRTRNRVFSSYQGHCKQVREYKNKLCIC